MDALKQAFEKLGLPENSSREEVEKKYDMLLRLERQRRRRTEEGESVEDAPVSFEEVNRAYRLIMEHEEQKVASSIEQEQYGKYKRFSKQIQKLDYFFTYYKWHVIIGIALIAMIIYGVNGYLDQRAEKARLAALPPADIEASFVGKFYPVDTSGRTEELEEAMLSQMPGWQRVQAEVLTFNMNAQDQFDMAMQQRVVIELATKSPDVYIMDADTFGWLARNGVLLNLDDEVEGRLKELLPEGAAKRAFIPDRDAMLKSPDTPIEELPGEEHYYGIDLSESPLVRELPLGIGELIVGIRPDTDSYENAMALIMRHLQAIKDAQ